MPLRDGTGPLGLGPGSGRRNDNCYAGFGYRNISRGIFHGRQGRLLSIGVPLVAAILRDLLNPSGVIRRIPQLASFFKIKDYAYRNIRDAQYSEINSQSVLMSSKKKAFQ